MKNNLSDAKPIVFPMGTRLTRGKILPVFLPFAGCSHRCIFCAQDKQSGAGSPSTPKALDTLKQNIDFHQNIETPLEIAFYGGTFTSLPEKDFDLCLQKFKEHKTNIKNLFGRCSTRPDTLYIKDSKNKSEFRLDYLKKVGIDLIELGIQSFHDLPLQESKRGYSAQTAKDACKKLNSDNFNLGIQLMPGMPGCSPDIFLEDVRIAISYNPACLRFYPCIVPDGTELATLWKNKKFSPWTLENTIDILAKALELAWVAQVPVIRLGVAQEASFEPHILAGPRHPAMGSMVQAQALFNTVHALCYNKKPSKILLPQSCQGFFLGNRNSIKNLWVENNYLGKVNFFHEKKLVHLQKQLSGEIFFCDNT